MCSHRVLEALGVGQLEVFIERLGSNCANFVASTVLDVLLLRV